MEYANVIVKLAGEADNTVPKYGVTAAEIAVLLAIHGPDSVYDIEPIDPPKDEDGKVIKVRNRDELVRLRETYSSQNSRPVVEALFPGSAARVHETIEELDLPDELFKPKSRAKPKHETSTSAADKPDRETVGQTRKPAKGEKGSASANEQAEADGITDILG